jgi:hypothetical protein
MFITPLDPPINYSQISIYCVQQNVIFAVAISETGMLLG